MDGLPAKQSERSNRLIDELSRSRSTKLKVFPQFRALKLHWKRRSNNRQERERMIFLDHQECRSSSVCRTTHRNPQLTHRTFLFSLYRSTSKSSYILGRGGLGDQPAEGVIPTDRNLFGGSVCSDHNDVPNFEVRAEWNDTHWFDLRPAAISCRQQLHHGGKHDCHF